MSHVTSGMLHALATRAEFECYNSMVQAVILYTNVSAPGKLKPLKTEYKSNNYIIPLGFRSHLLRQTNLSLAQMPPTVDTYHKNKKNKNNFI